MVTCNAFIHFKFFSTVHWSSFHTTWNWYLYEISDLRIDNVFLGMVCGWEGGLGCLSIFGDTCGFFSFLFVFDAYGFFGCGDKGEG